MNISNTSVDFFTFFFYRGIKLKNTKLKKTLRKTFTELELGSTKDTIQTITEGALGSSWEQTLIGGGES